MKVKLTWRIWLLIIILALSLLAIFPLAFSQKGVLVTSVEPNSTAFEQGFREAQVIREKNIHTGDHEIKVKFSLPKELSEVLEQEPGPNEIKLEDR